MTVYVYKYAGQGPKPFTAAWPHPWFGLTADTEEELHPFAEELGLYRQLYRPRKAGSAELPLVGHYDLDEGERDRALLRKGLKAGMARGELRPDIDLDATIEEMRAFMAGAWLVWLLDPGHASLTRLYEGYFSTLIRKLSA